MTKYARCCFSTREADGLKEVDVLVFPVLGSVAGAIQRLVEPPEHAFLSFVWREPDKHRPPRLGVKIGPLNVNEINLNSIDSSILVNANPLVTASANKIFLASSGGVAANKSSRLLSLISCSTSRDL